MQAESSAMHPYLCDSSPLSQSSAHAEQYVQTKTNTNPSPDPNRYRRRCPDPNARIQNFIHYTAIAAICDSGLSPVMLASNVVKYTQELHQHINTGDVVMVANVTVSVSVSRCI